MVKESDNIPKDIEAEEAVIASMMYNNEYIIIAKNILKADDFYLTTHQYIFKSILLVEEEKLTADETTVGTKLKQMNKYEECGGHSHLSKMIDYVPGSFDVKSYSKIVLEKSCLRKLLEKSTEISLKALDPSQRSESLVNEVMLTLEKIKEAGSYKKSYKKIKDVVSDCFKRYGKFEDPKQISYKTSGFSNLDKRITGLQSPNLIVIAARPSMGKSSLAFNIANQSAIKANYKGAIVIVSYEMSKVEVGDRLITENAKVDFTRIRKGVLEQPEYDRLGSSYGHLSELPIYIIDENIPVENLSPILREIENENEEGISLLIIDYMQIAPVVDKRMPREQQIALISRTLKQHAKTFDTPVIALSQLNRELEKRTNKRPMMSDLRESGAIEQDADIIMFIYRDEVYYDDTKDPGVAEIIIAKQRNGPVGTVRLGFEEQYTKFKDI